MLGKLFKVVLVVLLAVFVLSVIAGLVAGVIERTEDTASFVQQPPAQKPPEWVQIASWSGSGMKETETFTTTNREWRIHWRTSNEAFAGAGIFQVFVYNGDGGMVTLAANVQGARSDVSYVRAPAGPHYLMINSGNVDWTVTVEERR